MFHLSGRLLPNDEGRGTPHEAAQAGLDTLEVLSGAAGMFSGCRVYPGLRCVFFVISFMRMVQRSQPHCLFFVLLPGGRGGWEGGIVVSFFRMSLLRLMFYIF